MFSEVFKDKTIGLVITAAGVKTVEINEQYDKCGQIQAIWWTGFCWSFKSLGHRTTFESTANKKIREKWKFAKIKCQEYCSIFKKRNKDSNGKVTIPIPFKSPIRRIAFAVRISCRLEVFFLALRIQMRLSGKASLAVLKWKPLQRRCSVR